MLFEINISGRTVLPALNSYSQLIVIFQYISKINNDVRYL